MTKLLNRPLKAFTIYSLIILVISIPVYVFVVDRIWVDELDENNWLTLQHTKKKLKNKEFTKEDIEKINQIWGALQPGVSMLRSKHQKVFKDSIYEIIRPNAYDLEDGEDRFRGLKSFITLNGQSYEITIETNVEEADQTLLAITVVTFCFFGLLIIGFVLLNKKIAINSWKPFYKTLQSLKLFDITQDESLKLPETDIQEFQELNHSLEQLIKNNSIAYQQQKLFIENASHELQTPIALLKSKLDLLIQEKEVTPQIAKILSNVEIPLARLSRINKNLLILAKVENHQYNELEKLRIDEYIRASLLFLEDYINNKNITVTENIEHTIEVSTNSFLLETLVNNLLSNAIRHTFIGGKIDIQLENNIFSISNSGTFALNEKQLFERFSSLSKENVSSGLGLAIIKEIVNKYQWSITYGFKNGCHTFSITF